MEEVHSFLRPSAYIGSGLKEGMKTVRAEVKVLVSRLHLVSPRNT